jgi:transcriptional regulator of acetoin/glycerol metabolism
MRFQRPQSKREQAVTKAIESAIHQAGLGHDHPFKSADLLLEPVNEDLGARGYKKGISRSTLYRRLKRKSGLQE